jgi:hypothetical protein
VRHPNLYLRGFSRKELILNVVLMREIYKAKEGKG